MTISYGLCWNIYSRKIIWPPQAHFGSENESLKGLIMSVFSFNKCVDEMSATIFCFRTHFGLLNFSLKFIEKVLENDLLYGVCETGSYKLSSCLGD